MHRAEILPRQKSRTFQSNENGTAMITALKFRLARTSRIPQDANKTPRPPPRQAITRPSVSS